MPREAELYPHIKAYLQRQGYTVKGEVGAADDDPAFERCNDDRDDPGMDRRVDARIEGIDHPRQRETDVVAGDGDLGRHLHPEDGQLPGADGRGEPEGPTGRLAGLEQEVFLMVAIDARNGVVVRLGAKHHIATPLNAFAVALLQSVQPSA